MPQPAKTLPRVRLITNSPADEFASRDGCTRPISDALASLILARKETRVVTRGAVLLKMPGQTHSQRYGSPDCIISQPVMAGKEVIVVYNPLAPQKVHIFSESGQYIETVPAELQATWLQSDAQSKQALADARRAMSRAESQLQELHRPDTQAALERAQANAAKMQRAVVTLPPQNPEPKTQNPTPKALETRVTRELTRQENALEVIRQQTSQRRDDDEALAARAQAAIDAEMEA